jgi:hypothetical protein
MTDGVRTKIGIGFGLKRLVVRTSDLSRTKDLPGVRLTAKHAKPTYVLRNTSTEESRK